MGAGLFAMGSLPQSYTALWVLSHARPASVLVSGQNEAVLIDSEVGGDKFDVVYPSLSIDASAPVAIVNKVVDKKGSRKQATAYLNFLYSPEGQEIIAAAEPQGNVINLMEALERSLAQQQPQLAGVH